MVYFTFVKTLNSLVDEDTGAPWVALPTVVGNFR